MIRQLTAKSLRMNSYYVPDHIPDRAVIDPCHIAANIGHHYGIGDIVPYEYIKSVRIDFDKFTWEPYRRPTNARPIVSRAKREGLYCGKHSGSVTCMITGDVFSWSAKHCRQGCNQFSLPLRYLKKYREAAQGSTDGGAS